MKSKNKKSANSSARSIRQHHEPRTQVDASQPDVQTQTVEVITTTTETGKRSTKNKRKLRPSVTVLMEADDIVKDQVGGFVDFLRDNSVIALAIGFVAGSQGQALVKSLITSFIDPAFQLFFGKSLSTRTFYQTFGSNGATFGWGAFAYALLNIIFVLATIYILIKVFKLDRLVKPKETKLTTDAKDNATSKKSKTPKLDKKS